MVSDSGLDEDSCMSANASDYFSDTDSKGGPTEYDLDDIFPENFYSSHDTSCDSLYEEYDESQDISEVSLEHYLNCIYFLIV